jgi:ankyrin repeat protein/HEAT repeat protein
MAPPNAYAVKPTPEKLDRFLMSWCGYGNEDKVAELLAQGANPNASNKFGHTPLLKAVTNGSLEVIQLLIDNGADVNAKTKDGRSIIANAASLREPQAVVLLLKAGAKPDAGALQMASWLGRVEAAKILLEAGVDPNAGLSSAAQGCHVKLVKLLIAKGANVDGPRKGVNTPLHLAALQGGPETVKLLLASKADPNSLNEKNDVPLHLAISGNSDIRIVKLLVQAGASLDIANDEGITPVRLAAIRGAQPIYNWLVAANGGKEPQARMVQSVTTEKAIAELIEMLLSKKREDRITARGMLVARGSVIVPHVLASIKAGTPISHFFELLAALGQDARPALPQLQEALTDKRYVWAAARTIHQIGPGTFDALPDDVKKKGAAAYYEAMIDPKNEAGSMLVRYFPTTFGEASGPYLLKLLQHKNPAWRATAAQHMVRVRFASDDLRDQLIRLLTDDPNIYVKERAARGLSNPYFRSAKTKQALIDCLRTPRIRHDDLQSASIPEREKALAEKKANDDLLEEAARALAMVGPEIVAELMPFICMGSDNVWEQFVNVWRHLGTDAVPEFENLLDHRDERVRQMAFEQLGRLANQSEAAAEILDRKFKGARQEVRQFAADALLQVRGRNGKRTMPSIMEVLHGQGIEPRTRLMAVESALKIDPQGVKSSKELTEFLPEIIKLATDGEHLEQVHALKVLGLLGSTASSALPFVESLAEQELPKIPEHLRHKTARPDVKQNPEYQKFVKEWYRVGTVRRAAKESAKLILDDMSSCHRRNGVTAERAERAERGGTGRNEREREGTRGNEREREGTRGNEREREGTRSGVKY